MKTKKIFNWYQADILSERYFDLIISDFGSIFLLLIQAPAIAFAITLGWSEIKQPTDTLYYIMIISCVWFGCINACKEIVKERAIYQRERMFGLNIFAYVFSKIKILSLIGFIQCLLFLSIINYYVPLKGNIFINFLVLFLTIIAGSTLGLVLSAFVDSSDKAVTLAPIITIPQIIFSQMIIPEKYLHGLASIIEKLMIVKWGFESLKEIAKPEIDILILIKGVLILITFSFAYFILTLIIIKNNDMR